MFLIIEAVHVSSCGLSTLSLLSLVYVNNRDHKIAMHKIAIRQNSDHQKSHFTDLIYELFNVKHNLLYTFPNIKPNGLLHNVSRAKLNDLK